MRLLENRILVLRDSSEEKTASGIYIPEKFQENKNSGVVVLTGPGTKDFPMDVQPGDRISFKPVAGIEVQYDGKPHLIMKTSDRDFIY